MTIRPLTQLEKDRFAILLECARSEHLAVVTTREKGSERECALVVAVFPANDDDSDDMMVKPLARLLMDDDIDHYHDPQTLLTERVQ